MTVAPAAAPARAVFLRNCWYAIGWCTDFAAAGLEARTLLDEPLVLYRQIDGRLVALADRCCHRLAPLSAGRVEGDDLRCLYHGLRFDGSGQCVEIPGQPHVPPQTRVRSYPVVERHSIAWVWMGDAALADEALVPPFRGLHDPAFDLLPGRMDCDAHYLLVNDNLLDLSHLAFVHRNAFEAGDDFWQQRPHITRLPRGLRVSRWVEQPTPKYLAARLPGVTQVDTWISYDFLVPGVLLMDTQFYAPGTAADTRQAPPEGEPVHAEFTCQAVTPLTSRTSCHLFACGPWARVPGLAEYYREVSYLAFNEDKAMIEAQQHTIDQSPGVPMMPTASDDAPSQFRRLLDTLIAHEQQAAAPPPTAAATVPAAA